MATANTCVAMFSPTPRLYTGAFVVDGENDLSYTDEPHVSDMADALHMAGVVLDALQARLTIGHRKNEVNPAFLSRALARGETNAVMRAAGPVLGETN